MGDNPPLLENSKQGNLTLKEDNVNTPICPIFVDLYFLRYCKNYGLSKEVRCFTEI